MQEMKEYLQQFFHQQYVYRNEQGGLNYEIVIEGDPHSEDARIVVRELDSGKEYETTADKIDELPDNYHKPAQKCTLNWTSRLW